MKAGNLIAFAKAIPNAYATILFSDSLWIGLGLMALTFVSPIIALAGAFALLCALLASRLLGYEGWDSTQGVLAFNSLLVGLAIGYYYPYSGWATLSPHFFGLLAIASLVTMFLYIGLNYLCQSWFKMPSLSLAFSIAALFFWYYLVRSGHFSGLNFQKPLLFQHDLQLSWFWQDYFVSLGSIMFVPDLVVGILLALLLFMITRIGFMLSLMGWSICYLLMQYTSMGSSYGIFFPGFNLILISMAVGSVFLIPGKSSYLLAIFATVTGFLLAFAMSGKFYYTDLMTPRPSFLNLPIFALPMNIVVIGLIYSLRLRLQHRSPILNDYGILHPEKALDAYLSRYRRFVSAGVPQLNMPVTGQWLVTQGHNGEHTHKKDWALAWDFEIEDTQGKKYAENQEKLADYYCYGKAVYAAAGGYVAKVVNSVPDNPIGEVNTMDNWGNYISINHGYGFYTLYAHLKEGSVKLAEGDYIKMGEKIGQVGNSGRSFVPHLHFQAQAAIDAGSRTLFSHILNYKVMNPDGPNRFITSGIPEEGELVSALVPEKGLANILRLSYGQEQSFEVEDKSGSRLEHWQVDLDLMGNHSIVSDSGSSLDFSIYHGIFNALSLKGRGQNALTAFAFAAGRIPWIENQSLVWQDEPSLSVVMNPLWKNLTLFLIPFFRPIRVQSSSQLSGAGSDILIESKTELSVFGLRLKSYQSSLKLDRSQGIREIRLTKSKQQILSATHIEIKEQTDV
ncbi:MAG: urea transporter [Candidatus Cloacimonetes bacterium]|jgi:murein DD-endopeptidase MepM/ murein hydrolase activator NlpD|nr:urea transporter [Candidatus Cloacimonadota bacterium]MDD2423347.1 urea transporter [Candidatus Cloacimonadota bacterium]MDD3562689.1 urea transporter [Candidatus Cloacimonadota bacterium]MDD4276613.1 urea transporter [Candidatus Cloacimonadota bacterium]MDY0324643.1 urea transporter [Candidatus Cloacimonadaceae bacterium]